MGKRIYCFLIETNIFIVINANCEKYNVHPVSNIYPDPLHIGSLEIVMEFDYKLLPE